MSESYFERPPSSFDTPRQAPLQPAPAPPAPPTAGGPQAKCDLAVVSMILGIIGLLFGLFCLGFPFAVAAVICGHIARSQIRSKSLGGNGMAVAGLVTGYLVIALSALIGLIFMVGIFSSARKAAPTPDVQAVPQAVESGDSVNDGEYE